MISKRVNIIFSVAFLLFVIAGCRPEYSFEGGPPPPNDTIILPPPPPPSKVCPLCIGQEDFTENKWSCRDDTLLLCGIIDTAIVSPQRTGFTFYGPSACSNDTGIVITVPLEGQVLNQNLSNITLTRTAFYYYDNVGQSYIYMSRPTSPFTVVIETYDHSSKMATGTFGGFVFNPNGPGGTMIRNGRFRIKLF